MARKWLGIMGSTVSAQILKKILISLMTTWKNCKFGILYTKISELNFSKNAKNPTVPREIETENLEKRGY